MVPPTALAGASESTDWGTSLLLTRAFVKKPLTSTRPVSSMVRFAEDGVCAASGRATTASETSSVARMSGSWRFRYDYSKLQRLERNREHSDAMEPAASGRGLYHRGDARDRPGRRRRPRDHAREGREIISRPRGGGRIPRRRSS